MIWALSSSMSFGFHDVTTDNAPCRRPESTIIARSANGSGQPRAQLANKPHDILADSHCISPDKRAMLRVGIARARSRL